MAPKGELTRLWSGSAHQSRPDSGGPQLLLAGHRRAGFGDSSRLPLLAWRHLCCLQCKFAYQNPQGVLGPSSCASPRPCLRTLWPKRAMQVLVRAGCIRRSGSPLMPRAPPRKSRSSEEMLVDCCWAAAACVLTVSRSASSSARNAVIAASLDGGACTSAPLPADSPLDVAPGSPLRREDAGSSAAGSCW